MRAVRWRCRLWLMAMCLLVGAVSPAMVWGQQPQRPAEDEFVPVTELPVEERLPAAPLLIAAYSVAWVAVAAYLFSIWRRVGRVERELADVTRRLQSGRGATGPPPAARRTDAG